MTKFAIELVEVSGVCKYCQKPYTVRVAAPMAKRITNCTGHRCRMAQKAEYARKRKEQRFRLKTA